MSDDETVEEVAAGLLIAAIASVAAVAYLSLPPAFQVASSSVLTLSIGFLAGVISRADVEEHEIEKVHAVPFWVLGIAGFFFGLAALVTAPYLPASFATASYAGVWAVVLGLGLGAIAQYLDTTSTPDAVPDDPESVLDDGGDA